MSEPGGQLLLARLVPGRADLAGLATYLAGAATRAGAEIHLGVEATTVEAIVSRHPDVVVVATGARPGVPAVPGIEQSPAVDAFTVLGRPGGPVKRALVMGGGMLGVRPRWQHVADLRARPNVTIILGGTVEELYADGALVRRAGEDVKLHGLDLVVPTRPMVPVSDLGEALKVLPGGPAVFDIGDCAVPRTAFEAMQDAAALGHRL